MKYLYTAVFTPLEDGTGYAARVPDLPGCITTGHDLADALDMITDAASLMLVTMEDERLPIPQSTPPQQFHAPDGSVTSLVPIDTDLYRRQINTYAVRRNVSIPAWMDTLCRQRNVNVSQVLQDALRQLFDQ